MHMMPEGEYRTVALRILEAWVANGATDKPEFLEFAATMSCNAAETICRRSKQRKDAYTYDPDAIKLDIS